MESAEVYDLISGTHDGNLFGYSILVEFNYDSSISHKLNGKTNSNSLINIENATLVPQFIESSHSTNAKHLDGIWPYFASAGCDEIIKLYNVESFKEIGSLHLHTGTIQHIEFISPSHFVSCCSDGYIIIWKTYPWRPIRTLSHPNIKSVTYLASHPSEKALLAISYSSQLLALWDLTTARCAYIQKLASNPCMVKWSPSGNTFSIVYTNNIILYSPETCQPISNSLVLNNYSSITACHYITDNFISYYGEDPHLVIVKLDDERKFKSITFEAHETRIKAVTSDYPLLVTCSTDGKIKLWNICFTAFSQKNKTSNGVVILLSETDFVDIKLSSLLLMRVGGYAKNESMNGIKLRNNYNYDNFYEFKDQIKAKFNKNMKLTKKNKFKSSLLFTKSRKRLLKRRLFNINIKFNHMLK